MTYAPNTIKGVRAYLKGKDADLSDVELGIVGGPSHILAGTSYHLGADQLKMYKNPYSARTPRDKAGLSNAASALDIDDDLDELRPLSAWLVQECRKNAADTRDIREVIYSPDGVAVLRWDRERGVTSAPFADSDLSHRTHTHISWYRDSEFRDKTAVFKRFFEGDDDMSEWSQPDPWGVDPDGHNRQPSQKLRDTYAAVFFGERPIGGDGKPVGPEPWIVAQVKGLRADVAKLSAPAPVDAAKLKAVLLDPQVLAAIAKAVTDEIAS